MLVYLPKQFSVDVNLHTRVVVVDVEVSPSLVEVELRIGRNVGVIPGQQQGALVIYFQVTAEVLPDCGFEIAKRCAQRS